MTGAPRLDRRGEQRLRMLPARQDRLRGNHPCPAELAESMSHTLALRLQQIDEMKDEYRRKRATAKKRPTVPHSCSASAISSGSSSRPPSFIDPCQTLRLTVSYNSGTLSGSFS